MRTGTPFSSQSTARRPKLTSVRASSSTRTPAARSSAASRAAASPAPSSAFTSSTTTCTGAIRGGNRRPFSSPWAMISPPIMRVDTPHDVCQTYSWLPASVENWVPNALAKFWPSSWLVPICSALPSPIIASHVKVLMAPGNRSRAVLRPVRMGMASTFTMKSV